MPKLNLTADQVLNTTRAVRKRLDFDTPLEMSLLRECLDVALQAPSGSNSQGWHFVLVTDEVKRKAIADWYLKSFDEYEAGPNQPTKQHLDDPSMAPTQARVLSSARYLADNMARVPALLIPVCSGRPDTPGLPQNVMASMYGSILPAVWSFMLAARERGLGTCWTTLHLTYEREVATLLEIPDDFAQVALIPIAHTKGTDFKTGPRKDLDAFLHTDGW
ncbi:MAG: nitroreductase family protein [Halieaceae bacterium]|nr:nitroreductase family protein [Halieaceae bacterium]MCP4842868.1 nitroreductase family protein [Halieaceae bacterium]MDG2412439.1 nitroreductase family protein [Halioglobus sp.]